MDATEIRKQIFKKHIIAQKHFFFVVPEPNYSTIRLIPCLKGWCAHISNKSISLSNKSR